MILLTDLILEINEVEERSIWTTYSGGRTSPEYGARNTFGEKRYFANKDDAIEFARGAKTTPAMGRQIALHKLKAKRMERKQKYDVKPVVNVDAEKIS
jgi:hypothetical protein